MTAKNRPYVPEMAYRNPTHGDYGPAFLKQESVSDFLRLCFDAINKRNLSLWLSLKKKILCTQDRPVGEKNKQTKKQKQKQKTRQTCWYYGRNEGRHEPNCM